MAKVPLTKEQLKALFDAIDTEKKGKLTKDEFYKFSETLPSSISSKDINNIYKHMKLEDYELTFEEFYIWWQNGKEKKLLPLLYVKKQIEKSLNDAKNHIKQSKLESSDEKPTQSQFQGSVSNGTNDKETLLSIKISTHKEAESNAKFFRDKLDLQEKPTVIFKIRASKNIDEALRNLEDLVEQGKQILECMLPIEYSEQYLQLVDIKVQKDEQDLYLSVSSNNDIINSIYSSYQNIVDELNIQDQSISFEAAYSSKLDLKSALERTGSNIFNELISGLNIDLKLSSSSIILDNLRCALYTNIDQDLKKSPSQSLSRTKTKEYGTLVLASLLNGISVKLNSNEIEKMLPADASKYTFEAVNSELKKKSKTEDAMSLPIFQDLVNFLNEYTLSQFNLSIIGPGLYADLHFSTQNLSVLLNQYFTG